MTAPYAIVFPGQGSQFTGMLSALACEHEAVQTTFEQASSVLGYDLWALAQGDDANAIGQTTVTQPLMLSAGVAVWRVWQEQCGNAPVMLAGHSLGEYTAWVASGALGFEQAVQLVAQRAQWMQSAVPEGEGAMAAVLGVEDAVILEVCAGLSRNVFVVEPVNFNAPGQVVIAGHASAVSEACKVLKEMGARRAVMLPVSVPSHSSLMSGVAEQLNDALADMAWSYPNPPVVQNVSADCADNADINQTKRVLAQQVCTPVQWVRSVKKISESANTLIELGGGKVLTGLNKRIDKTLNLAHVDCPESLQSALCMVS